MADFLPPLHENFEPTRATLHAYAHGIAAVARAHAAPHPKWWHVSLRVIPRGLVTDNIRVPGGGLVNIRMDLTAHDIVVTSLSSETRISMTDGLTGTQMGERLISAVAAVGLEGEYERARFQDDGTREYLPDAAAIYFQAVGNVSHIFQHHLGSLEGSVSRVQLWPHNFDLACEWFGSRMETHEEGEETTEHPSQINLGFYPAGRAYFYSNPWPFDRDALMGHQLPHGAEWHTEGWEGSILYYDRLAGDPDAATKLAEYARAVYDLAAPTLTA